MQILIFILLFSFNYAAFSQDEVDLEQDSFEQLKTDRLKRIRLEILDKAKEIQDLESKLAKESELIGRLRYETKLKEALRIKEKKRLEFIETATNVNLDSNESSKDAKKDFADQLKELFEPIVKTIRDASEKPRMMQDYKERLEIVSQRHANAEKAIDRLKKWQKTNKDKSLSFTIKKSIQTAKELAEDTRIQKEDLEFKIKEIDRRKGSLVSEISNIILGFFKTKGKNLFLAFLAFLLSYWAFKRMRSKFINIAMFQLNKDQPSGQTHWVARPLRVIYSVFTVLLSLFFSLLTLYILNDFVLVTFIVFLIVALIWSSKEYFPVFFEQSKMILNLGPVREGERIVYNGLAWHVKSMGYFCRLENPKLAGGTLRINTRELLNHYSRPASFKEPWFPTESDDWIELMDGTFGKVILQTPEQVAIKLVGSETRYMLSKEFIEQKPTNLSNGFSIEFAFGVDYGVQKILFSEVIPNFKKGVLEAIRQEYPKDIEDFKELSVEFLKAGSSSLDLRFFVKCDGKLASRKRLITRKINAIFVELCNQHDYVIPFNQLTVHMNNE